MRDKSTHRRSLAKALSWETFAFFLTILIIWAMTGDLRFTIELSIICQGAKVFFFFLHERIWHRFKWGKEQDGHTEALENKIADLRAAIIANRAALLMDDSLTIGALDSALTHLDATAYKEL